MIDHKRSPTPTLFDRLDDAVSQDSASGGETGSPGLTDCLESDGLIGKDSAVAIANEAQLSASDPWASVFVSASAGSGKTKLLIDRLLRLMLPVEGKDPQGRPVLLEGGDPARILCLTYTKAAAAEMANRLQELLGRWVGLSDVALSAALRQLDVPDTQETRRKARGLFLKVLDLPGGLRIETIHAFCQSLLRRFPLEAVLDPHFSLIEESEGRAVLQHALEEELTAHPDYAAALAGQVSLSEMVEHIVALGGKSGQIAPLLKLWQQDPHVIEALYRHLLKIGEKSLDGLDRAMCSPEAEELLRMQIKQALPEVTEAQRPNFDMMLEFLATEPEKRESTLWQKILLTADGKPRAMSRLVGKKAQSLTENLVEMLEHEARRQVALLDSRKELALLTLNKALITLVAPVLLFFQQEKARRGVVDYNDLIAYTSQLLHEPGAAWVMYKLDGGIDHLLLDEVQDTSAQQWEIAGALTADFFSGEAAHAAQPRPRTIFAVGDFKQSIYSFQGAEPEQFHKWRHIFAERVKRAGLLWREPDLNVSFRSVQPVLNFVDAVFSCPQAAQGVKEAGKPVPKHLSARPDQGGMVEIWPLVPVKKSDKTSEAEIEESRIGGNLPEEDTASPWIAPQRNTYQKTPQQRLAEGLADWIGHETGCVAQPGQPTLKAGDIMVLVPRRSGFVYGLIRALKTRNIPVASFLNTELTGHVVVKDLITLCSALLLPQDDLTFASVLTSPWGGVSDESLMELATDDGRTHLLGKTRSLWDVLRDHHEKRPDWQVVWNRFSALYRRVDYETPYGILMLALGQEGGDSAPEGRIVENMPPSSGRARFLARLGHEAAEPLDELLTLALRYEEEHIPSLQGFLHWVQASEIVARREAETSVNAVRIMTAHGSKGLQAPLVILPDTMSDSQKAESVFWSTEAIKEEVRDDIKQEKSPSGSSLNREISQPLSLPLWVPRQDMATQQSSLLKAEREEQRKEEKNRLLYVALTRARDRLIICGWGDEREESDGENAGKGGKSAKIENQTWYEHCKAGFSQLQLDAEYSAPGQGDNAGKCCGKVSIERFSLPSSARSEGWGGEKLIYDAASISPARVTEEVEKIPQEASSVFEEEHSRSLPVWMGKAPGWFVPPPPIEAALARPLAPSRPEGVEFGPQPASRSPLAILAGQRGGGRQAEQKSRRYYAMQRGRLIHRLLQLLPDIPSHQREARAFSWLIRSGRVEDSEVAQNLARQVSGIMDHPDLAPLFGPGSHAEQAISGTLPAEKSERSGEGRIILGRVDRLAVHHHIVWLCDYKTGRPPARHNEQIPEAYLRQMAAYHAVMADIYPDHEIRCCLVWTEGPSVTSLSSEFLRKNLY